MEHAWDKQHRILWDAVSILGKESKVGQRTVKEASFITSNENSLCQASKGIPQIWFNTMRNAMKDLDNGTGVSMGKFPLRFGVFTLCKSEQ